MRRSGSGARGTQSSGESVEIPISVRYVTTSLASEPGQLAQIDRHDGFVIAYIRLATYQRRYGRQAWLQ